MANLFDLIGRIFISLVFLLSGYNKIFNYDNTISWMEGFGIPGFLLWPAIVLEILLPIFIIIGYRTQISAIILAAFFVNYHYGHQGLMPLDDLQNFNSGFRVLNGDFPFRDYYSITGPILDIWQSNLYDLFGVSWKSFILHASILNCVYAISIFIFLNSVRMSLRTLVTFLVSPL